MNSCPLVAGVASLRPRPSGPPLRGRAPLRDAGPQGHAQRVPVSQVRTSVPRKIGESKNLVSNGSQDLTAFAMAMATLQVRNASSAPVLPAAFVTARCNPCNGANVVLTGEPVKCNGEFVGPLPCDDSGVVPCHWSMCFAAGA